jgi:uncharacterized protein with HEPN domain
MQHEVKTYLFDIIKAGELINDFINGKSFKEYENDTMMRSAVERQFEIIGEALNCIMKTEPEFKNKISDIRKIINFRNILIHGYSIVSNDIVWGIIELDLKKLLDEVQKIYDEN